MTKEELENKKLERRAKEWLVKDKGGSIIQSLINLIKEFAEPKEKQIQIDAEQEIKELEKENAELKSGCGICYQKDKEQLTKAKEIIKDLCIMVRELNKPNVQLTNIDYSLSEAKQFLKESE